MTPTTRDEQSESSRNPKQDSSNHSALVAPLSARVGNTSRTSGHHESGCLRCTVDRAVVASRDGNVDYRRQKRRTPDQEISSRGRDEGVMSSGAALMASSKMAIYSSPMRNVLAYITSASIAVGRANKAVDRAVRHFHRAGPPTHHHGCGEVDGERTAKRRPRQHASSSSSWLRRDHPAWMRTPRRPSWKTLARSAAALLGASPDTIAMATSSPRP